MKLETLILEFGADFSALDTALNQASQKARQAGQLMQATKLAPSTDETKLTQLNTHIESKRTHLKEIQAFFDANPLTVKTDSVQLDAFIKDIQSKIQSAINVTINGNYTLGVNQSASKTTSANTAKEVGKEVGKAVKQNAPRQGLFGMALSSAVAGSIQGVVFERRRVFAKGISDMIDESISAGVAMAAERGININDYFVKQLSTKLNKSLNKALDRGAGELVGNKQGKIGGLLGKAEKEGLNYEKQIESFFANLFAGARARIYEKEATIRKQKREDLEKTEESLVVQSIRLYESEQKLVEAREESNKKVIELIKDLEGIVSDKIPDGETVASITGQTDLETLQKRAEYLIGRGVKHGSLQGAVDQMAKLRSIGDSELSVSRQKEQNTMLLAAIRKELAALIGESPNQEFLKILRDLNNGKLPDEASIPRLVVSDARLKERGASALYNPTANTILISSEIKKALESVDLDESQLTALAHEIQHAIDLGFGSAEGKFLNRVGLTKDGSGADRKGLEEFLDRYEIMGDHRVELESSAEKAAREYAKKYYQSEVPPDLKSDPVVAEIRELREAIIALVTRSATPDAIPLEPIAEKEPVPIVIGQSSKPTKARGALDLLPPKLELQFHSTDSIKNSAESYAKESKEKLEIFYKTFKSDIKEGDIDKAIESRNLLKEVGDETKKAIDREIESLRAYAGDEAKETIAILTNLKAQITRKQKRSSQDVAKLGMEVKRLEKMLGDEVSQLLYDELASFNIAGLIQKASGYTKEDFTSFNKFLNSPKTRDLLKEATVNAVGLATGIAGGSVSGDPNMALVSELAGSLVTRKAVTDIESVIDAYIELSKDKLGDIDGFFQKIGAILNQAKQNVKDNIESFQDELTADAVGFGVGNVSAAGLHQAGVGVPMEGAAVAIALTPKLVAAKKQAQAEIVAFLSKMKGATDADLASLPESSIGKYRELLEVYQQISRLQGEVGSGEDLGSLKETLDALIERSRELMNSFGENASKGIDGSKEQIDRVIDSLQSGYEEILSNPLVSGGLDILSGIARNTVEAIRNPVAAFDALKTKLQETKQGFIAAGIAAGTFAGIVAINTLLGSVANAVRATGREFENLKVTINTALGRQSELYLEKLYDQTFELGIGFLSATKGYKQFAGALTGTSLQPISEDLFSIIQKVSAVNSLTESETESVGTAIAQIASKGVVSMEELRQQLSERLPGAMQIAARSMNMTIAEFNKAVESGSIMSEDFLPKFLLQYEKFADAGLLDMDKPLMTSEMQLQNSIDKLKIELSKSTMGFDSMIASTTASAIDRVSDFATIFGDIFGIVNNVLMLSFVPALGVALAKLGLLGPAMAMTAKIGLPLGLGLAALSSLVVTVGLVRAAFDSGSQSIRRNTESITLSLDALDKKLESVEKRNKTALSAYGQLGDIINAPIKALTGGRSTNYADLDEQQTKSDVSEQLREGDKVFSKSIQAAYSPEKIKRVRDELQSLDDQINELNAKKLTLQLNNSDPAEINKVQAKINELVKQKTIAPDTLLQGGTQYIEKTISSLSATKKELESLQESNGFDFSAEIKSTADQIADLESVLKKLNATLATTQSSLKVFEELRRSLADIPQDLARQQSLLTKESLSKTLNTRGFGREQIEAEYRKQAVDAEKDSLLETQKNYNDFFQNLSTAEKNSIEALLGKEARSATMGDIEVAIDRAGRSNLVSENAKKALDYLKESIGVSNRLLEIDNEFLRVERERLDALAERARNLRQLKIVEANVNERIDTLQRFPFGGAIAAARDAMSEVRNQERILQEAYRKLDSGSEDPNVVRQEIANTRLALEQARASLFQQQAAVQDYYRNLDRQVADFNRQLQDYTRRIEDTELTASREARSLSESYTDLNRELERSLADARNRLLETRDRIANLELRNELNRGLNPGGNSLSRQFNDTILEILEKQAESATRGRSFESRSEEVESAYIASLRRIRDLQESQEDAERNRLRTIQDIQRTQEDLNRTLSDLIRQANRELGYIPDSIKAIVTNLDALPAPVKAIENELTTIPPNVKTAGSSLVNSISETARAIEKVNARLNTPISTNVGSRGSGIPSAGILPVPNQDLGDIRNRRGTLPPPPAVANAVVPFRINQTRGLTARGQDLAKHLDNPLVRAFLDTISYAEGTAFHPNQGYNTLFGGSQFSSFADHPNRRIRSGGHTSSASGRYQVMDFVHKEEKSKLGLKDFTPFSQDLIALSRLQMRGALDNILKGDIAGAITAARNEWASFPGAGYGQPEKWMKDLLQRFERYLRRYQNPLGQGGPEGDAPLNLPLPQLPPPPNLDASVPQQGTEAIRSTEQKALEAEKFLQTLQDELDQFTALDKLANFAIDIQNTTRELERSIRNSAESTADLIQNAKGYLTVTEEIANAGREMERQYRSQIEALEDRRRELQRQKEDNEDLIAAQEKAIARLTDPEQIKLATEGMNALKENSIATANAIVQVDANIAQLGQNQGIAVQVATARQFADSMLAANERHSSIMADLADRQSEMNPFVTGGAPIRIKSEYRQRASDLDRFIEKNRDFLSAGQISEMRSGLQEMANTDLAKAFVDANPALSGFRDILKGAVIDFGNLGQTALNVLQNIANKLLDNGLNALLGGLFGGGGIGNLFGSAVSGASGAITSSLPFLPTFAHGGTVEETLAEERRMSGQQPQLVVAHRGEEILTTLNQDAQFYRALKRSGQWDELKAGNGIPAYARGGTVGTDAATAIGSPPRSRAPIVQNITFVIQANDPNSFRATESQIRERMERRNREINERYR
jgi:tape measure domain-containing protein